MMEMKDYVTVKSLLLRESTAELLDVENRIYSPGEPIELPDHIAKRLLQHGSIVPAPVPELPEPVKSAAKKPAVKKATVKEAK